MNIIEELGIPNKTNKIEIDNNQQNEVVMEDFFATTISDIEEFNTEAWNKKDGICLPHYKNITEKLEGMDSGLYLFAGASNHGKTAIMMNLLYDACTYEPNNLFGIIFSLDDSKKEIIPRIIAMEQEIPIGVIAKPQRYRNIIDNEINNMSEDNLSDISSNAILYEEYLMRREIGIENLKSKSNRIKIEDSNKIRNTDDIYNYIVKILTYIKTINEDYKIIIAIDSINDIRLSKRVNNEDTLGEIARTVKQWTVEFNCPILASTHIRKLNGNRRPVLDDLRDSSVLVYEASVVYIVYNDVSANKQAAKIYQIRNEHSIKEPILELDWAKNKKSTYKGKSFCYFKPEFSKTIECDEEANKRYSALIYEE